MESCRSVTRNVDTKIQPPAKCHLPVYSTLGHLISILEKLRNKDYAVPDNPDQLTKLKFLLDTARDMEVKTNGGTKLPNQEATVIGTLEMELKKLQQTNAYLAQESTSQLKSLKNMEQRIKPLQEKNKKFLEKNIELTNMNRSLKDETQSINDENKKLRDQCEQCRKRVKQLTQQLSQEKMEKGELELKLQEMEKLKQQLSEQTKMVETLKMNVVEKDRRIELVQHRKRRKKVLRSQDKGVKETSFGYDEDDRSFDSETSLSLSTCTMSDDELCDELSRKELESNYARLMKEHLELQKLHAMLTSKNGSNVDPQREGKLRSQLEASLYVSQCKIEQLKETLQTKEEILSTLEEDKTVLQSLNRALTKRNIDLESKVENLKEKLNESQETIDNLEFQVIEMETQDPVQTNDNRVSLETIPEDPLELSDLQTRETIQGSGMDGAHGKDAESYIHALENTAQDLQKKVSHLQHQNALLEEKCVKAQRDTPTLEEKEAQEVLAVKESIDNNSNDQELSTHNATRPAVDHDPQEIPEVLPAEQRDRDYRSQSASPCKLLEICEMKFSKGEISDLHKYATELSSTVHRLEEENSVLKEQIQNQSFVEDETDEECVSTLEQKVEEMKSVCENLQERIHYSETSEKQLKDKLKLAEYTINDLEGSETTMREQLEKARRTEAEAKKLLSEAQNKIRELKEIVLDKDVIETDLAEKVQFLEKAEELSSQKIAELEAQNQLLQQRLDLKEDLEADILLVETLNEKINIYAQENKNLSEKVSELEENEEILKINWMKVAENDADRISSLEEKLKNVESLNKDLRCRMREYKEKTDLQSLNCPSLAAELSESDKSESSTSSKSKIELQSRINNLEEEVQRVQESKDSKIENLQDELARLKDNEIKLSETVAEMEQTERELKSRLSLHQQHTSSVDKMMQYEGTIRNMQNSQENLLNRIDSMEDHEVDLKTRLKEMEAQMKREQKQHFEMEQGMTSQLLEKEKHEEELLEKVSRYKEVADNLENKISNFEKKEHSLVIEMKEIEQQNLTLKVEIENLKREQSQCQNHLKRIGKENQDLQKTIQTVTEELEQVQAENGDLNERLIDLDSSEQECMEKMQKFEKDVAKLEYFRDKVNVLEDAESRLMDRVTELEELELKLTSDIENYKRKEKSQEVLSSVNRYLPNTELTSVDKETDTSDLIDVPESAKARKLTGMFERLQEIETDNQTLSEQLASLQDADSLNKQLSEKVKLLENSEDRLMERVMELEDIEDRQKRELTRLKNCANMEVPDIVEEISELRKTVELLKVNVEILKSENEEYQEKIKQYVDKISVLELQECDNKQKMRLSEENEQELQILLDKSEQLLSAEKQKVTTFLQGEERLFKSLAAEKNRTEELENELSLAKDKLEDVQTRYEIVVSEMSETISQKESKEKEFEKDISELSKENEVLLKLIENNKSKPDISSCNADSEDENSQEFFDADSTSVNNQNENSTPKSAQNFQKFGAKNQGGLCDISGIVPNVGIPGCKYCGAVSEKLSADKEKMSDKTIELQSLPENKQSNIPTSVLFKTQTNLVTGLDTTDSFFDLNQTEEFHRSVQQKQQQCEKAALKVTIAECECKIKELEDQLEAFQIKIRELVGSFKQSFSEELTDLDKDMCDTFQCSTDLPVQLDASMVENIEQLELFKHCLKTRLLNIRQSEDDFRKSKEESEKTILQLQNEISSLKNSEAELHQQVHELESKGAQLHQQVLEQENKEAQQQQQVLELESKEAELHQQVLELENKETQLHQQVLELESKETQLHQQVLELESKEAELHQQVLELESKEAKLQQQVLELESKEAQQQQEQQQGDNVDSAFSSSDVSQTSNGTDNKIDSLSSPEVDTNTTDLLRKIQALEQSKRSLERRLEYFESLDLNTSKMLDKPEDILRQRITELEKLEKHLKVQVTDLEQDREELHEIARKDKNTIHEQNIRIRELQLADKNMKEQINRFEESERNLYQKVEELEDQISTMEVRISELTIMEMRLKELVRKYKLDEEVWLSKSENLTTSISQLSMSEAQLKQQLENVEKEKISLAEKSEYMELRLKEVENAESNLLQRTKDQENKEIMLNNKLSEMQMLGSNAEMQAAEFHNVNMDLSQRLNQAAQENTAMVHHLTQLQNHTQALNQQIVSLQESEKQLQQETKALESSVKSLDAEVKESKIKEVQAEGKVRQLEESESLLKDKIGNLQRSENRLKYQVQQLQSGNQVAMIDLSQSQREKLPRKLEDCQKRIIFLQNQNEELVNKLNDHRDLMASKSVVNIPQKEYKQLQAKIVLLEQTEAQLDEADQLNSQLRDTIDQLRQGKDVSGHEAEIDVLKKRLEESTRTISALRQLIEEGQFMEEGPIIDEVIKPDRSKISHSMYNGEMPGHQAERRAKGQRSTLSSGAGHPVQKLANQMVYMNHKGRQLLDDQSDASTVEEDIIEKRVQGRKSQKDPYSMATKHDRRQAIDNLVGHLDIDDMTMPQEEAHWRMVESRRNQPPNTDDERWIHVGKATSLHSSVPHRSHPSQDEELVLGLTLPSETESNMYTQNDTDSNMSSPAMKRRKFRPVNSTESYAPSLPLSVPPSTNSHTTSRFGTPYYLPGSMPDSISEGEDANYFLGEEYKMIPGPPMTSGQRPRSRGSLPDSGHGTTSVASTGKTLSLREKIAEIGRSLQKTPFTGTSDYTEDEESMMYWKTKTSEAERHLEDAENERKYMKDEINKLEKDLEEKCRYILILEQFIERLEQLLQSKDSKSDKELIQTVEAELQKTLEEAKEADCRKLDLSLDPVALNTELNKRERELSAKRNEVDGLMKELKQWQEECRTIEDMRTNALDALHFLEEEVADLHSTEKDLKMSKDAYNKLQEQFDEIENTKNHAQVVVATMKAQVARLSQKCREKDDLLKRLGKELRKLKGVGKPMMLLEELSQMERKMFTEEYNTQRMSSDYGTLGQHGRGQIHRSSMTDLKRSSSSSSLNDSQDIAHSDTEVMDYNRQRIAGQPYSADQWDRRQRPLSSNQYTQQLPNIHSFQHGPSYSPASDFLPVGHMPPDPMFLAVLDYNPQQFSRSGRKEEELILKEWDQVKVIGPLDETGYYMAEVDGIQGLVPCAYLRQANLVHKKGSPRKPGQMIPSFLDASPEKIIQMHDQLNRSHRPNGHAGNKSVNTPIRVNGHVTDLSSKSPRSLPATPRFPTSTWPLQKPSNFKIEKVNKHTLMLTWTPPAMNENNQNNGIKVIGYKIYLNGKIHQQVNSPHIAKTLVRNIDVSRMQFFYIQTLGSGGEESDFLEAVYEERGRPIDESEESSDLTNVRNHEQYREGRKRLFVGVYDFAPSPGKHGNLELAFQAGDRITVYGEERLDGFYYGEMNGRRGLVPGFFMEEIPLAGVDSR